MVEANPAWLELFGVEEGIAGQPLMDLFEEATHAALRGALAACLQGRWQRPSAARQRAARRRLGGADGDRCSPWASTRASRACAWSCRRGRAKSGSSTADRRRRGRMPAAGFLHRAALLEALGARLASPLAGRHALLGTDQARQVRRHRARRRRHRQRGRGRRVRAPHQGTPDTQGARRPLRRRALPGAARARQRARHRGVERAAAGRVQQARHASQRQVGLGHLHHRALGGDAERRQPGCGDRGRDGACRKGRARGGNQASARTRPTTTAACSPTTRCGSSTSRRRSWRTASGSCSSRSRACRATTPACSTCWCA